MASAVVEGHDRQTGERGQQQRRLHNVPTAPMPPTPPTPPPSAVAPPSLPPRPPPPAAVFPQPPTLPPPSAAGAQAEPPVAVVTVVPLADGATAPRASPVGGLGGGGRGDSALASNAVAIGVVAAAFALAVAVLAALFVRLVRRRRVEGEENVKVVEAARALMEQQSAALSACSYPGLSPASTMLLPMPQPGQSLTPGNTAPIDAARTSSTPRPPIDGSSHARDAYGAVYGRRSHTVAAPGSAGPRSPGSSKGTARSASQLSMSAHTLAAEGQSASAGPSWDFGRRTVSASNSFMHMQYPPQPLPSAPAAEGGGPASTAQIRSMFHPPTDLGTLAESDAWRTLTTDAATPRDPGEGAGAKERLTFIAEQLDAFGPRGRILGRYELLGEQRCRGGQALVQFVRSLQTHQAYAIKFFANRSVFDDEKDLYVHCCRGLLMPAVVEFVDNEDGSFRDPFGNAMPPCFVMEKGESLTERSMRCKNDLFTIVQVIGQVASCLAELHGHGWVHRDLKPGNIMFLPRTGSWTLIDFGLAARTGETTRMGFTLAYAPPEVVHLHQQRAKTVVADPAVDAWALGVMAFELLTGTPAFNVSPAGSEKVRRQLLGKEPLPWEPPRLTAEACGKLGAFRAPILATLSRDPARRPSCKQLAAAVHAVLLTPGPAAQLLEP